MLRPTIASLVLLASISVAHAQEPAPMMPAPDKPLRASITMSPIHLALPVGEVAAEIAVSPKIGVAVIGGIGSVTPENSTDSVSVYEIGVSPRYYILGDFRQGVQLGAEILYVHASADSQVMSTVVAAEGLALGAYAGYKWVASFGLTLEAQLGGSYLAVRGDGVNDDDSQLQVLLNLQVGWSF